MTTQALQDSELFQTGYLVDGVWKSLDTTFDVLNPATGEVVAKVAKAGKRDGSRYRRSHQGFSRLACENRKRAFRYPLSLVRIDY
jgi:acyl-CoA reductase-like NAD-dependent aldehyde dehydrogenase